jgi:UDP-3-O-[3-hydroxymyristoyl] glucosamine N-acyltransferase LpxD
MMVNAGEITQFLNANDYKYNYLGKQDIDISGFSSIRNISANKISWVKNKNFFKENILKENKNILLIINKDTEVKGNYLFDNGFIVCSNPKEIFFAILNEFYPPTRYRGYISPQAVVETSALGRNVYIGPYSFIDKDVKVGDNVIIKHNVSIEGKVEIGANTIIHSGVRIGTDGFGYYQDDDGINRKVPHYGGVIIGKNVEVGANTCIDRGTLDDTIIGDNVKISNLCHIAHNVSVQENCLITATAMISGSTIVGKNSYIAPGAMIKNQLRIGVNSLVGMGSVVIKDVEDHQVVAGVPARILRETSRGGQ